MVLPVARGTRIRDTLRKATRHHLGRTRLPLGRILHQGLIPWHPGHTHHSMGTLNRVGTLNQVVTLHMVVIPLLVIPAHLTRVCIALTFYVYSF